MSAKSDASFLWTLAIEAKDAAGAALSEARLDELEGRLESRPPRSEPQASEGRLG
jgi:hypothetical protein